MTRHPLDPKDSVRECEHGFCACSNPLSSLRHCAGASYSGRGYVVGRIVPDDLYNLWLPAADPTVIEVCLVTTISNETEYYWNLNGCVPSMDEMESGKHGPFDTEDVALLAGRCAVLGIVVYFCDLADDQSQHGWYWKLPDQHIELRAEGPFPTPNDAIAAAIDARKESE